MECAEGRTGGLGVWCAVLLALGLLGATAASGCAASGGGFGEDGGTTAAGGTGGGVGGSGADGGGVGGSGADGAGGSSACPIDCSTIETDQCREAICNEQSGSCQIVDAAGGTSCDDQVFCTVADQCEDGACMGGPDNDCGLTPEGCELILCDEGSQSCSTEAAAEGTSCSPADLCTVNAVCENGLCVGSAKDCTFAPVPNECFNSACNSSNGQCEPVAGNDGTTCVDDVDQCQINGTCSAGSCINTVPVNCDHLTAGCVLGLCDSQNGSCFAQNLNDGDACDDLDWCTTGETCQTGQCQNGQPVTTCVHDDHCCPVNCDENDDNDCACNVGWLQFSELNNGDDDYVVLHNPTACVLSLNGLQVLFDDSSSSDLTTSLPNQNLAPGASVYIAESAQAGDIPSGGNIMFAYSRGGAALLCDGPCNPANGSNVIDVVAFDGGEVHGALPPPVTFSPAGLTGITSSNHNTHSWLRVGSAGVAPSFLAADWVVGNASR